MPCRRLLLACVAAAGLLVPTAASAAPTIRSGADEVRYLDGSISPAAADRTLEGDLVEFGDGPQRYMIETASGRLEEVDFAGRALPARVTNGEITARVAPSGAVRSATVEASPRISATPTAHRAYIALLTNGTGDQGSESQVRAQVQTALTRWRDESNGAITSFAIADVEPFTTATDCSSGSAMYNEAGVLFPGVSFGAGSGNHLIVASRSGCGGGFGTIGSSVNGGGRLNFRWLPASALHTLMHELGHNLSLQHANACSQPSAAGCGVEEYANTYALMGYTLTGTPPYTPAGLDSFERQRLQITDPGELAAVALPAGQRTAETAYDLRARGTATGLRGLRVTDPQSGLAYSVDWRSGGGRDADSYYGRGGTLTPNPGITVQQIDPDGRSATLQAYARPAPASGRFYALTAGQSFATGGVRISVASLGDRTDPLSTSRVGVALNATPPVAAPSTPVVVPAPAVPAPLPPKAASPRRVREPAKLELAGARIDRSTRRLVVVAPITARASGDVRVVLRAAGRTTSFTAPVDAERRRIRIVRRVGRAQARAGTGILELRYAGDADTQPEAVRLRIARRAAALRAGRPTVEDGVLRASGRIDARARGVVRVQLVFETADGAARTLDFRARVERGRYRLAETLPRAVQAEIAGRLGVLHSSTQYTGDRRSRLRGELASLQVLGAP